MKTDIFTSSYQFCGEKLSTTMRMRALLCRLSSGILIIGRRGHTTPALRSAGSQPPPMCKDAKELWQFITPDCVTYALGYNYCLQVLSSRTSFEGRLTIFSSSSDHQVDELLKIIFLEDSY